MALVIGWDIITALNDIINPNSKEMIFLMDDSNPIGIPLTAHSNNILSTSTIQQIHEIIQQHSAIIPENTKKSSVTQLVEFYIDTNLRTITTPSPSFTAKNGYGNQGIIGSWNHLTCGICNMGLCGTTSTKGKWILLIFWRLQEHQQGHNTHQPYFYCDS
jgi:hypothetical protein